jgi:hypothetical protein
MVGTSSVITEPAPHHRALADPDWRNEASVASDERARPDFRPEFLLFSGLEVAGNGPGSDVHPLPDLGIADVRQMQGLCALADLGGLDLHKISDPRPGPDFGAGPKVSIWADLRLRPNLHPLQDGKPKSAHPQLPWNREDKPVAQFDSSGRSRSFRGEMNRER